MAQLEKRDVYIFFGPDFAGKHMFYKRELTNSHVCVRPSCIYQKNPTYGFRDVCFQIVSLLKEGWKVAIVDKNECKKTRMSYVKLLQKKCGEITFGAISILPKYGCDQLFWTRELRLAEESCKYLDNPVSNIPVCDSQIQKWFMGESNMDVSYQPGIVEKLSENEGFKVEEKVVGVCTRSVYKFEVPALFIQWELLCKHTNLPGLIKVCQLWADTNSSGRIIVICDGYQIFTGESKRNQEVKSIDETIKVLLNKFTSMPVYVFHVCEPKIAGSYIIPPKPGILAFLQQRHCLNLHSKRTLYVYDSTVHMKMAEAASVRHVKGSRLIDHPELVMGGSAIGRPAVQEMLQTMRLLSQTSDNDEATIPLYTSGTSSESRLQQHFAHGRSEYLYSHDQRTLDRYNSLYKELATKVGDPGSKFSPKKHVQSSSTSCGGSGSVSVNVPSKSSAEPGSRDLPKWMLKRDSKKAPPSLEKSASSDASVGLQIRKTVYVMTDKELLEVACEVLKQGGKTNVVEKFLQTEDKETDCKNKSEIHTEKTSHKKNVRNAKRTHGNKKANLCPKIERASDSDIKSEIKGGNSASDIIPSVVRGRNSASDNIPSVSRGRNSASDNVPSVMKGENSSSDINSIHDDDSKMKVDELIDVENIVADVLDEFSASKVTPKRSPRKRARVNDKGIHQQSPCKRKTLHTKKETREDHSLSSDSDESQHKTVYRTDHKKPRRRQYESSPDMSHLEDIF